MDILDTLINYGLRHGLIQQEDIIFTKNTICTLINHKNLLNVPKTSQKDSEELSEILDPILQLAVENGVLVSKHPDYADLMDTAIMGLLVPKPSLIQKTFEDLYKHENVDAALKYFYDLSIHSNYIRMDRIKKNYSWKSPTPCGDLEITINLSKPEKDPKALILARIQEEKEQRYPTCLLCKENVGFAGNFSQPARQNLRTLSLDLRGSTWHFQYSPYIYYNEHSIIFSDEHTPMALSQKTFEGMFDFLDKFPSYFIGSNADLPIVGGVILNHEHYQAGRRFFPLDDAKIFETQSHSGIDVEVQLLRWPINVLRLTSKNRHALTQVATKLLHFWSVYSDEKLEIIAETTVPHNTITPIARFYDGAYRLDIALRNNRVSEKYPLGIFHPHMERHHIKKENIGIIEVMGLAILPGRLIEELALVKKHLIEKSLKAAESVAILQKHVDWMKEIAKKRTIQEENADQILQEEIAQVFYSMLCDCAVFKKEKDFSDFIKKFLASF